MENTFICPVLNIENFNKDLPEGLKNLITACIPNSTDLKIYTNRALTTEEHNEIQSILDNHKSTENAKLRVFRVLPEDQNPMIADFSILGFKKISPSYERGRKTRSLYKCIEKDEVIVEKIFRDIRDEKGILTDLEITFNWYDEDGNISLSKVEIAKSFNKYQAQTEERKRRERQLDYLIASGIDTPLEPYIDMVFEWYSYEEQHYRTHGSKALADALKNETDPARLAVLNIDVIPPGLHPSWPDGQTLREGVLWQVTGEVWNG